MSCGDHSSQFELANTDEVSTIEDSGAESEDSEIDENVTAHPPVVLSGAYLACSIRENHESEPQESEKSDRRRIACVIHGMSPMERSRLSLDEIRNSLTINGGSYENLEIVNQDGRLELRFNVPASEVFEIKDISVVLSVGSETVKIETVTQKAVEDPRDNPENQLNSIALDGEKLLVRQDSDLSSTDEVRQVSRDITSNIKVISERALSEVKTEAQIEDIKKAETQAYEEIRVIEQNFTESVAQLQEDYQSSVSKFNEEYFEKITLLQKEAADQIRAIRTDAEQEIENASESLRLTANDDDQDRIRNTRGDRLIGSQYSREVNEKIESIWIELESEKEKLLKIKKDVQRDFVEKYRALNLEKSNKIESVTKDLTEKIKGIKKQTP